MNETNLLTVIVPTYNLEDHIRTCMDSLLNQSYKNFSIIVIDDASTDDTFNILCNYQNHFPNIILLKNPINQGTSYSRNRGLELVQTKYVMFLDGDDWVDSNCIEKALSKLEENEDSDIAIWNIYTVYSRSNVIKRYYYENDNTITSSYALKLYTKSQASNIYISPLLGNKMFRFSLIQNSLLRFHGTFYEDDIFMFYAFLYARKIEIITGTSLYYYQREGSLMHSFSQNNINELFHHFSALKTDLLAKELWTNNEIYFYSLFEKCIKNMFVIIKNSGCTDSEERLYLYNILQGIYTHIAINEYVNYCDLSLFYL